MTDRQFVEAFETCTLPKEQFHHRDHLRLAWIYLKSHGSAAARVRIVESIRRYAAHLGVSEKYHETITIAWMRIVEQAADDLPSFEDVLAVMPELRDKDTLQTYYSPAVLQSEEARTRFVEPDLKPLPGYLLTSKRLGFRCWSLSDAPLANALWGDERVTALLGGPFPSEDVERRLHREIECMRAHNVQYWPIFLLETSDFTGCAGLRPYRIADKIYELGCHLRPQYWRRGLAEEASRALIPFAFGTLGAEALFAGHHPDNLASRRMLEKLGFRLTHEELCPPTGLMHPSYLLERQSYHLSI